MKSETLTFKQFQDTNASRCEANMHPIKDWTPLEWIGCAAGELGEAANLIKKLKKGKKINKQYIAYELADTISYLSLTASSLGIELDKAIIEKFNIVSDRYKSKIKL